MAASSSAPSAPKKEDFFDLVAKAVKTKKRSDLNKLQNYVEEIGGIQAISFNALDTAISMYENNRPPLSLYNYLVDSLNQKYEEYEVMLSEHDDTNNRFMELFEMNTYDFVKASEMYLELDEIYKSGKILTRNLITSLRLSSDKIKIYNSLKELKQRDIYYNMHFVLAASNGATRQLQNFLRRAYVISDKNYQKAIKIAHQMGFEGTEHYLKSIFYEKRNSYGVSSEIELLVDLDIDHNKIEEPYAKLNFDQTYKKL
jgi:hypothetical protein